MTDKSELEKVETESRISYKDRVSWILPICGAIIAGLLYYAALPNSSPRVFIVPPELYLFPLIVVSLFMFVYTVICELATNTLGLFFVRGIFIIPSGVIVSYILNLVSPKIYYNSTSDSYGIGYTTLLFILLFFLCFFISGFGTLVVRLVKGREPIAKEPKVMAFSTNSKYDDVLSIFEDFLCSLSLNYEIIVENGCKSFRFKYWLNQYTVFLQNKEENVQITFLVVGVNKDTIVEPDDSDFEILIGYFETFFKQKNRKNNEVKLNPDLKLENSESLKVEVWRNFTAPFQLRDWFASRGLQKQKLKDYLIANKLKIASYIVSVIIGGIIINLISKLITG